MQTIKSQSNTKPQEWDITSSGTTVYHNYNIVEVNKESVISYEYDVDKMSHQEYNIQLQKQITEQQKVIDQLIASSLEV